MEEFSLLHIKIISLPLVNYGILRKNMRSVFKHTQDHEALLLGDRCFIQINGKACNVRILWDKAEIDSI